MHQLLLLHATACNMWNAIPPGIALHHASAGHHRAVLLASARRLCFLQVLGGVPTSRQGWIARYREVHGRLSTMPDGGISLAEKTSLAKRNKGPPLEELSSLKDSAPEM